MKRLICLCIIAFPFSAMAEAASLLYTPAQMKVIAEALDAHRIQKNAPKPEPGGLEGLFNPPQAEEAPAAPTEIQHPQFSLRTLVYYQPDEWAVWLNDKKFTPELRKIGDVTLLLAEKSFARFLWQPDMPDFYLTRPVGDDVRHHPTQKGYVFSLQMNQSFSAKDLSIHEGRLPPIVVEQLSAAAAPGQPVQAATIEESALPAVPSFSISPPNRNR